MLQRRTALALGISVALALTPDAIPAQPLAGPPVCTGVATATPIGLWSQSWVPLNPIGRNLVSIPVEGPLTAPPLTGSDSPFHRLCALIGLFPPTSDPATMPDLDGDGLPDDARLIQYNGNTGEVVEYWCHLPLVTAPWNIGQGVEIRPYLSSGPGTMIPIVIPGVECTFPYAAYKYGPYNRNQLYPVPATTTAINFQDICDQLNLPPETVITGIDAENGFHSQHSCGQFPIFDVVTGAAVLVSAWDTGLPPGEVSPGDPVNCAAPAATAPVCPPTPAPPLSYPCGCIAGIAPCVLPEFC